jgi:hypothetical protein
MNCVVIFAVAYACPLYAKKKKKCNIVAGSGKKRFMGRSKTQDLTWLQNFN